MRPDVPPPPAAPPPRRWRELIGALEGGLLERAQAVRLVLLSALAGEHALLIGPPGTAKSELARRLHRQFEGGRYFERLLTRFSTPEELFGPLSLKALEDDRYERLTDGFLPTAGIAFLDEVFKANSAILNALLTLLNERMFDNGPARLPVPLISVVAASNEVPVDEALHAFFDRFLVRIPVQPVSDAQFERLLRLPPTKATGAAPTEPDVPPVSSQERAALLAAASQVRLSQALIDGCIALRAELQSRSLPVSDRRWRQWMDVLRVAAAAEGRPEVDELDLWMAPFVASPSPEVAPALAAWFENRVLAAAPRAAPWLTRAVEAFEKQLEIEMRAEPEGGDDAAGKLAIARSVGLADTGEGMARIVSEALEAHLRRRYSRVHIAARVTQVNELLAQIQAHALAVRAAHEELADRLSGRLWIAPQDVQRWLDGFARTLALLESHRARLAVVADGFAALPPLADPAEEEQATGRPAPVRWSIDEAPADA